MIKKLTVIGLLLSNFALSQQIPLFNQHFVSPVVYNPAYTGYVEGTNITLLRNQKWTGFEGGAIANYLNVSLLMPNGKTGLGIDLYSDYIGFTSKLSAHLTYAYAVKLGRKAELRFGIAAGAVDNRINFSKVVVPDPTDPILGQTTDRQTTFDINAGLNLSIKNFDWAVWVPQATGNQLQYAPDGNYVLERQYFTSLAHRFTLGSSKEFSIKPMAVGSYLPGAPIYYEGILIAEHSKFGWASVGYKNDYAASFSLGFTIKKQLKIGVSYDMILNALSNFANQPNAEVILTYGILPRTEVEDSYRKPLFAESEKEKLEKLLAEKQRKIDSLHVVNDSIVDIKDNIVEEKDSIAADALIASQKYEETIDVLNDSISELNRMLADMEKNLKTIDKNSTRETDEQFSGVIRRTENDHFLELNKSETPNGYYAIVGAFGRKSYAERLLSDVKSTFPNARIIFNERNNLHYVLIASGSNTDDVFESAQKALKMGYEKAWVLNYQ